MIVGALTTCYDFHQANEPANNRDDNDKMQRGSNKAIIIRGKLAMPTKIRGKYRDRGISRGIVGRGMTHGGRHYCKTQGP